MTIVGLFPPDPPDKTKAIGFYVPTDPDHPVGDQCKYYMHPFDSGDAEELLTFICEFIRLIDMKGAMNSPKKQLQMMCLLLRDKALKIIDKHYTELVETPVDENDDEATKQAMRDSNKAAQDAALKAAIRALLEDLLPTNAGTKLKEDLWSFGKPCDMSVTDFLTS